MPWYSVVACFFGGAFLANFFLHLIAGLSGRQFPTPFAKPPFRGLSSPVVNVLYALSNLAVAYGLLVVVAAFEPRQMAHAVITAAGFGLASIGMARAVVKVQRRPLGGWGGVQGTTHPGAPVAADPGVPGSQG